MVEESLLILKPDAVLRRFVGVETLKILLSNGLIPTAFKEMVASTQLAKRHYAVHEGKPFYDWLVRFITSGPVVAMRVEGEGVIQQIRKVLGSTFAHKAEPDTIRGKYGIYGGVNVAHASDADQTATEELGLWEREAGLKKGAPRSVAKQIDSYVRDYGSRKFPDHTQELRKTCLGLADGKINEESGGKTLTALLNGEFQEHDRKYLKGFSSVLLETCLMDRAKKQ
ncbi:MAG: nucleoside-diphosphate kinase [Promethearchaeati archaeon SRVP18_Atabeyarchaeia-1]